MMILLRLGAEQKSSPNESRRTGIRQGRRARDVLGAGRVCVPVPRYKDSEAGRGDETGAKRLYFYFE